MNRLGHGEHPARTPKFSLAAVLGAADALPRPGPGANPAPTTTAHWTAHSVWALGAG